MIGANDNNGENEAPFPTRVIQFYKASEKVFSITRMWMDRAGLYVGRAVVVQPHPHIPYLNSRTVYTPPAPKPMIPSFLKVIK